MSDMVEALLEFVFDITGDLFMDHGLEKINEKQGIKNFCKIVKRIFITIIVIAATVGGIYLIIYG